MQLSKADAAIEAALGALKVSGARFRLRDILVEEVSLVDRAANKRRFLVVKQQGDNMGNPDSAVQKLELSKTTKAALLLTLTNALERFVPVVHAVKGADELEADGAGLPADLAAALAGVGAMLSGVLDDHAVSVSKQMHVHSLPGGEMTGEAGEGPHMHSLPDGGETGSASGEGHTHSLPDGGETGPEQYVEGEEMEEEEMAAKSLAKFISKVLGDEAPEALSAEKLSGLGSEFADKMGVLARVIALIADVGSPDELADMGNRMLGVGKALKRDGTASQVLDVVADVASATSAEAADGEELTAETVVKIRQLAATLNELVEKYPSPVAGEAKGDGDMTAKADDTSKNDTPPEGSAKDQSKDAAGAAPGEGNLDNADKDAADAAAAKNVDADADTEPGASADDIEADESVVKMAEAIATGVVVLSKAGRKMSRVRLRRMRNAVNTLGELLGELDDEASAGDGTEKRVAETTPQPPDKEPGDTSVGHAGPPDKRNDKAENLPAVEDVLKRVDELQAEVKKLADTPEPPASRADENAGSPGVPPNGGKSAGGPWVW